MTRTTRAFALAAALMLSAASLQADTREERLAVAEDYSAAMVADMDMAALIATMWKPLADQQEAVGQPLNDSQKDRLQALYMDKLAAPMRQMMLDQAPIMADLMTLAEITALRDFYQTPEGRAVMLKLPRLVEAQQPQVMALISGNLMPIMDQIQEIMQTP